MKRSSIAKGQAELAQIVQLLQSHQIELAEKKARALLAKMPQNADAWRLLGDALFACADYRQAFDAFQQSLTRRMTVETLLAMAAAAHELKAFDTEENCLRHAIKANPRLGCVYYRLALALDAQSRKPDEMIPLLEKAIALGECVASAYAMIGHLAQHQMNDRDLARNAYLGALDAAPDYLPAITGLAELYWSNNHLDEAMALAHRAMSAGADAAHVYQMLSNSLLLLGRHEECIRMFRQAIEMAPDDLRVMTAYLFATNYSDTLSGDEWLSEHRKFGEKADAQARPFNEYPLLSADPERKLRIGYVSGDLRHNHPVTYFFEPILECHDRERFEIYCYYNYGHDDEATKRLKQLSDGWCDVTRMSNEQMANQIRDDRIDVLVDLSGHTGFERLAVFAWKPAPVQFTWLGYVATTGMSSIGYTFTDKYYTPDQTAEQYYVEKPVYLPVYRVFRPVGELEVKPLPALDNGYITFGSFNNFLKLNHEVLELWAELLRQIPDSRFAVIVNAKESIDYVKQFFGSRGISEDRLLIFTRLNMSHFLQLHWHVDLALDPFPFNGATTSFHGLWMGVPMISMIGQRVVSRTGYSLLGPLGLEEFVARTPTEYIDKAKYWAANLDRLAEIRAGLRERLKRSPLLDEAAFTRSFEAGFRNCWREWCAGQVPAGAEAGAK